MNGVNLSFFSMQLESFKTVSKTSAYTASTEQVIFVDATSAAVTITLPAVASSKDRFYFIKKIDSSANAVTIDGAGSETIDGQTTIDITTQNGTLLVISIGTVWYCIASFTGGYV